MKHLDLLKASSNCCLPGPLQKDSSAQTRRQQLVRLGDPEGQRVKQLLTCQGQSVLFAADYAASMASRR